VSNEGALPRSRRRRGAARRRSRTLRRAAGITLIVVAAALGGVMVWAGYTYWSLTERIKPAGEEAQAITDALSASESQQPESGPGPLWVLLLGSDARPGESRARADTIILARLDPERRTVAMVSIPRDTRVNIPGYGVNKINSATAFGGAALMIRTVRDLTGLPVDHYLEIDFEGFKHGVDAMGGITIDVERSIYDPKAADYVRSASRIGAGEQTLDGARALTFVRSRSFADGDYTRMRNQQTFMIEFIRQALEPARITKLPGVASSIATHIDTDMSIRELLDLAQMFQGLDEGNIKGYTIPSSTGSRGGVSYVLPDEGALIALADALQRGELPAEEEILGTDLDFSIAVVNGTEIDGVARRFAGRIEQRGFSVAEVLSDMEGVGGRSAVIYRSATHAEEAALIAHVLGDWPVMRESSAISRRADVVVLVGPGGARSPERQALEH